LQKHAINAWEITTPLSRLMMTLGCAEGSIDAVGGFNAAQHDNG